MEEDLELPIIQPLEQKRDTVSGKRLMLGYVGLFLIFIGIITLLPLIIIIFYPKNLYSWWFFYLPSFISILIGAILYTPIMNKNYVKLNSLESLSLTILIWIVAIVVSAFPYFIWGNVGGPNAPVITIVDGVYKIEGEFLKGGHSHAFNNYSECIFEAVSGFSSTGLTLFPTFKSPAGNYLYNHSFLFHASSPFEEYLPNCEIFLFHRSIMTFTGGIGLVLILSSALNKRSNVQLYMLEGHGDALLPNLVKSARIIFFIYIGMFVFGLLLFMCIGASFFDAICYTMAGVSTGGFASHATSIRFFSLALGETRGILIEIAMIIIMFLGMIPFLSHFFLLKGKFKKVFLHYELFVFLGIIILFYPLFLFGMIEQFDYNYPLAIRHSFFEFTTFISTSGFASMKYYDYNSINSYLYIVMIVLTIVGGFSGSTAGGLKLFRIGDLFISIKNNFIQMTSRPEKIKVTRVHKFGNQVIVNNDDLKKSLDYIGLYLLCVIFTTCILIWHGYPFTDSLFEVASAFAGLGETSGISYTAAMNSQWGVIWFLSIAMLLGRLEIQIVFFAFMQLFKRIANNKNVYRYSD